VTSEDEELRRLRRENAVLREEREILNKAAVSSTGGSNSGFTAEGAEAPRCAEDRIPQRTSAPPRPLR
jgi:transposase-like protein